eukprot:111199-Pelagomonas_calceolata.AAC.1
MALKPFLLPPCACFIVTMTYSLEGTQSVGRPAGSCVSPCGERKEAHKALSQMLKRWGRLSAALLLIKAKYSHVL